MPGLKLLTTPRPLRQVSLRRLLGPWRWAALRSRLGAERPRACEVCGRTVAPPGKLFAQDVLAYDLRQRPAVARLERLALWCWDCHSAAQLVVASDTVAQERLAPGSIARHVAWFCRVNRIGSGAFERRLARARTEWDRRSQLDWTVDFGPYAAAVDAAARSPGRLAWQRAAERARATAVSAAAERQGRRAASRRPRPHRHCAA